MDALWRFSDMFPFIRFSSTRKYSNIFRTHMAEVFSLHPKFQMSSNTPREISFQMPQEPARNLSFQMYQSLPVTSRSPIQSSLSVPGLTTLRSLSGLPNHQIPSRPSMRPGFHVPKGPMALPDKYDDKQCSLVGPRKERKERTVYTKEQKRLLQEYFNQYKYPNQKQCEELALLVHVSEMEIKIWFKNNRAKNKRMSLQNITEALPETNQSSKAVSDSTHFPGSIPVVVTENGESMCLPTFGGDSIPKFNCSQESTVPHYQACDGDQCTQQEALIDGHVLVRDGDSGQSTAVEVQTDIAVAEAPVGMAAAAQVTEDAQGSGPSAEELWQRILDDFDTSDDWLSMRYIPSPSNTSQPLDQSWPLQP